VIIREATAQDVSVLARMRWNLRMDDAPPDDRYPEYEARFSQFLTDALESGLWMAWVIEQEGEILAHIYLQLIEKVPRPGALDQHFGYVTNVYTRPDSRNQGLGAQLMNHVIEWAKTRQLEFMILWPSDRSAPFYQRAGFEHPHDTLELILNDD